MAITTGRPIPQAIDEIIVFLEGDFPTFNFRGGSYIHQQGHFVHCFNENEHFVFEASTLYQLYRVAHFGLKGLI